MTSSGIFDEAIHHIEAAYAALGHTLGWNFLYSPARTLSPATKLMLVGINPGAKHYYPPIRSEERGNAYRPEVLKFEKKGEAFQNEVCALFARLARQLKESVHPADLMDRTLTANLCPFRSPTWVALPRKAESLAFSLGLWRELCAHLDPAVVICLGGLAYRHFGELFRGRGFQERPAGERRMPTGHGDVCYRTLELTHGARRLLLAWVPNFGRFQVMSPPARATYADAFIAVLAAALNRDSSSTG